MIKSPKTLITLAMLYVAVALACDPLAYKIIDLKFTPIIGASMLFPLLYAFVDVITELYGEKLARFVVYVHIFCDLTFTFLIIGIIHLPSPHWFRHQEAFNTVFDPMARLYIAGVIGVLASFLTNIYLLARWQKIYGGKFFWLRSFAATAIGILIYTVVTDSIAFVNIKQQLDLTIANTITNIGFAAIYLFICIPIVRILKHFLDLSTHKPHDPYKHHNL